MASTEEWREISGFPRYEVSNLGRVRSFAGHHGEGSANPRILTPFQANGYLQVGLRGRGDGRKHLRRVHALVAQAFIGPRPDGHHVCHNDSDRTNNCVENLRYGTALDNVADQLTIGTHPSVKAAAKDRCANGHAYDDESTVWQRNTNNGRPARRCRICKREQDRARYWRVRNAA